MTKKIALTPSYNILRVLPKDGLPLKFRLNDGTEIYDSRQDTAIKVEKGEMLIHCSRADYQDTDISYSFKGDCTTSKVEVEMPHLLGKLEITSSLPYCDVFLDGERKGTTPIVLNQIYVGQHHILIQKEGYLPKDTTLRIEQNRLTKINLSLNQIRLGTSIGSGRAKNVHAEITPQNVIVHYDLTARSTVKMQKSYGDSQQWSDVELVSGDVNKIISRGNHKKIIWDIHNEMGNDFVADNLRFRVEGDGKYDRYARPSSRKIKTILLAQMAYASTPQMSYGATFGQMYGYGYGWYVDFLMDFKNLNTPKPDMQYSCDHGGIISCDEYRVLPLYTGKTYVNKYSFHLGYMMDLIGVIRATYNRFNTFGFYTGLGYGSRINAWELASREWALFEPSSSKGVTMNIGLFGSFYGLTFKVGMNTIQYKYYEVEAGFGFMF